MTSSYTARPISARRTASGSFGVGDRHHPGDIDEHAVLHAPDEVRAGAERGEVDGWVRRLDGRDGDRVLAAGEAAEEDLPGGVEAELALEEDPAVRRRLDRRRRRVPDLPPVERVVRRRV